MADCGYRITAPAAALLALMMSALTSVAYAEIWECVDKESGAKRYTNIKSEARGCRAMNFEPVVAAPRRSFQRTANFPSVDDDTQRQRDADRRRILDLELAQEEQLLSEARKQLAEQEAARTAGHLDSYQDAVKLHEDNIASLKKEIGNTR
ncbi:MAG TPA: hypothetical protein VMT94_00975 [Burkholderiales bacterium]|nr:hypothetical protein [Burkholderiales bacterium]